MTRARIMAGSGAAPDEAVQFDGDIAATLPLTTEAAPDALTIVRPA